MTQMNEEEFWQNVQYRPKIHRIFRRQQATFPYQIRPRRAALPGSGPASDGKKTEKAVNAIGGQPLGTAMIATSIDILQRPLDEITGPESCEELSAFKEVQEGDAREKSSALQENQDSSKLSPASIPRTLDLILSRHVEETEVDDEGTRWIQQIRARSPQHYERYMGVRFGCLRYRICSCQASTLAFSDDSCGDICQDITSLSRASLSGNFYLESLGRKLAGLRFDGATPQYQDSCLYITSITTTQPDTVGNFDTKKVALQTGHVRITEALGGLEMSQRLSLGSMQEGHLSIDEDEVETTKAYGIRNAYHEHLVTQLDNIECEVGVIDVLVRFPASFQDRCERPADDRGLAKSYLEAGWGDLADEYFQTWSRVKLGGL